MKPRRFNHSFLLATASSVLTISSASAQDASWTATVGGDWTDTTKWDPNIANGANFTANFTSDISTDVTVSLGTANRTIGNIVFGDGNTTTPGNWTIAANGTNNTLTLAGTTPTITVNALGTGKTASISAIIAGSAGLRKSGVGTLELAGANTYTGGTIINAGTLRVAPTGSIVTNGTINIANGATFRYSGANVNLTGAITGQGGITYDVYGQLQLSSTSNSFSGPLSISDGRVLVTAVTHLSSGAANVVQTGDGQLYINASATFNNPFSIGGKGFKELDSQSNLSGAIRLDGTSNLSNTITLTGNSRIGKISTSTSTISGKITGGFGIDFYGMNTGSGQAPVFVLSNAGNDYTGDTAIINSNYAGINFSNVSTTLRLGASNVIPDGASAGNVVFGINGTNGNATIIFDLNGRNETINGLTVNPGTFSTRITNTAAASSASTLTIGANNTTSSFNGTITDTATNRSLAITKIGNGTLTLSGTNTYNGPTTVNAGTLLINGNTTAANGTVATAGLATLGGSGRIGGNTTILANGTLAPGGTIGAIGNLTFARNLTFDANSTFAWNVANGTSFDTINVLGTLAGSGAVFNITGANYTDAFWNANQTFANVFNTGNLSAIFSGGFAGAGGITSGGVVANRGTFSITGTNLNWTAIPEPSTALGGLLLAAGLLRRRRSK